jgi:hypothetical protein
MLSRGNQDRGNQGMPVFTLGRQVVAKQNYTVSRGNLEKYFPLWEETYVLNDLSASMS